MLKWPNDLLLDGAKLAGILLERSGERIVVGFGVNLAAAPRARPTARRRRSTARSRPQAFAPLLAGELRPAARAVAQQRARRRRRRPGWRAPIRSAPLLTVHVGADERVSGRFDGLEPDGALRLRTDDGRRDRPRRRRQLVNRASAGLEAPMLLAIDAGNTNLVFALLDGGRDQGALADRHRPAADRRPICGLAAPVARARRLHQGGRRRGDHRHGGAARAAQSRGARRANISTSSR